MSHTQLQLKDYLILAGLTALWCLVAGYHELGHDEAQAWNIARSAEAWWDVAWHSRYEGHTPLWFAVLWPLTRTGDPVYMQILAVVLSVLVAALLLKSRRFPRIVCVLLVLGYFIGYEYAILPRPYIIALTLCALFATVLCRKGLWAFPALSLLCALLGSTSSFGVVLSASLMFLLLLEWVLVASPQKPALRTVASCVVFYTVVLLIAVYTIVWPIEDRSFETEMLTGQRVDIVNWSKAIETAALPHFNRLPMGIGAWLGESAAGTALATTLAVLASLAVFVLLMAKPSAAISWLVAVLLITAASLVAGLHSERQMGHLFMAALVLIWVRPALASARAIRWPFFQQYDAAQSGVWMRAGSRWAGASLMALLLYQVMVGLGAMAMDIARPLTPWKQAYQHIKETESEPFVLITDHAYNAGALLAKLDLPAYNMRCDCWTRYGVWQGSKIPESLDEYREALKRTACDLQQDHDRVLVLRTNAYWPEDLNFEQVIEFKRGYRAGRGIGPVLYGVSDGCGKTPIK